VKCNKDNVKRCLILGLWPWISQRIPLATVRAQQCLVIVQIPIGPPLWAVEKADLHDNHRQHNQWNTSFHQVILLECPIIATAEKRSKHRHTSFTQIYAGETYVTWRGLPDWREEWNLRNKSVGHTLSLLLLYDAFSTRLEIWVAILTIFDFQIIMLQYREKIIWIMALAKFSRNVESSWYRACNVLKLEMGVSYVGD
jgi:hypothetical protein